MIPDLYKDIKIQLYERATSPLLGSFVISWCLWNYKLLLVFFSSAKALDKIKHINEKLYPEVLDVVSFGIVFPLITTLAFIFIYPIPALYIYEHTRKQQAKLKEVQQKIEDETPLTQEEAREIRSNLRTLLQIHDEEISSKDKDIANRDAAIEELNIKLNNAEKKNEETEVGLRDANAELSRWQSQSGEGKNIELELKRNNDPDYSSDDKRDWKEVLGALTNLTGDRKDKNIVFMAQILKRLGIQKINKHKFDDEFAHNPSDAKYNLELLINNGLIDSGSSLHYDLTPAGRNFVVEQLPENIYYPHPKPIYSAPLQQL